MMLQAVNVKTIHCTRILSLAATGRARLVGAGRLAVEAVITLADLGVGFFLIAIGVLFGYGNGCLAAFGVRSRHL